MRLIPPKGLQCIATASRFCRQGRICSRPRPGIGRLRPVTGVALARIPARCAIVAAGFAIGLHPAGGQRLRRSMEAAGRRPSRSRRWPAGRAVHDHRWQRGVPFVRELRRHDPFPGDQGRSRRLDLAAASRLRPLQSRLVDSLLPGGARPSSEPCRCLHPHRDRQQRLHHTARRVSHANLRRDSDPEFRSRSFQPTRATRCPLGSAAVPRPAQDLPDWRRWRLRRRLCG